MPGSARLYDRIGEGYDGTRRADPRIVSGLVRHLRPRPGGRYLDIACGTGNYTAAVAKLGIDIAGIDISARMLAEARRKAPEIAWCEGDAAALPFADRTFDGAIITLAIHHFAELSRAIREAARVLRASPLVLFTAFPEETRRYWLAHYFPNAIAEASAVLPSLNSIETALEDAGLHITVVELFRVPPDLADLFLYSGKHRPALYLDPRVLKGISTFARFGNRAEIEEGLARLAADIATGAWARIKARYAHDGGDYAFVAARS